MDEADLHKNIYLALENFAGALADQTLVVISLDKLEQVGYEWSYALSHE